MTDEFQKENFVRANFGQGACLAAQDTIPFSFKYGGKASTALLPSWRRTVSSIPEKGRRRQVVTYTDPETELEVVWEKVIFDDPPAVEWVVRFHNKGKKDVPILEEVLPLDLPIKKSTSGDFILHYSSGSSPSVNDFLPIAKSLLPDTQIKLRPNGGRSSDGYLPFFNLQWPGKGLVVAVGWAGQWKADFCCVDEEKINIRAGMENVCLKLHPDESIRTPKILLVFWEGNEWIFGNNLLRRLLIDHYLPRAKDSVVIVPVAHSFQPFGDLNKVDEENQLAVMEHFPALGIEAYWLDAGWFEGEWPNGAGNWTPDKRKFPNGLKPLSEKAHLLGMKFVLWFEPERVNADSQIAKEHPEWLLHVSENDNPSPFLKTDSIFNLGILEARTWMTNLLSRYIGEWGIDILRIDANIAPLKFWQNADSPGREGITEIRYIEGLYILWDELLVRHPGLIIDNCASGGKRLDLETISRSIPLWREDYPPGYEGIPPFLAQAQTAGLSLYLPLHGTYPYRLDTYGFRSSMTTGIVLGPDPREKGYPVELVKKTITELKRLRPFFLGDYYPLFKIDIEETSWCGYQFDRPDLGEGVALLFRRDKSLSSTMEINLRNLNSETDYELTFEDTGEKKTGKGKGLFCLIVEIPSAPGSLLLHYRRITKGGK